MQVDSIGKEVENSGYGYLYKDVLPVSLLGLVDDMIGVSNAGFKAQQLNALLNDLVVKNPVSVDNWKVSHVPNTITGESDIIEWHEGQIEMGQTNKHKYLGFFLSHRGDNLVNISEMKKKSIWIIRKMLTGSTT